MKNMTKSARRLLSYAALTILTATVLAGYVVLITPQNANEAYEGPLRSYEIMDIKVIFVGERTGLANELLKALSTYRQIKSIFMMTSVGELTSMVDKIDHSWIIIFDSKWLRDKVENTQLHRFLEFILPRETKILAIGNSTSLLFEVLDRVRDVMPDGRNPAYFDPPAAGYKLRVATLPDGRKYYGDSIYIYAEKRNVNVHTLIDAILMWI